MLIYPATLPVARSAPAARACGGACILDCSALYVFSVHCVESVYDQPVDSRCDDSYSNSHSYIVIKVG